MIPNDPDQKTHHEIECWGHRLRMGYTMGAWQLDLSERDFPLATSYITQS